MKSVAPSAHFAIGIVCVVLSAACNHVVVIDTVPSGGEVRVNGDPIGQGPVSYNEQTGWEKVYDVEVTKPGYKPARKQVKQSEWNIPVTATSLCSAGACAITGCGLLLASGLLWSRQMPDQVSVPLEPDGTAPRTPVTPPPPVPPVPPIPAPVAPTTTPTPSPTPSPTPTPSATPVQP